MPHLPFSFLFCPRFLISFFNIFLHSMTLNCNMQINNSLTYMEPLGKSCPMFLWSRIFGETVFCSILFSISAGKLNSKEFCCQFVIFISALKKYPLRFFRLFFSIYITWNNKRYSSLYKSCLHPYFPTATLLENRIQLQSFLADCTKQGFLTLRVYCNGNFISGRDYPRDKTFCLRA